MDIRTFLETYFTKQNLPPIVVSILIFIWASIRYRKSKREKKPVFSNRTIEILPIESLSIDKLQFVYDRRPVTDLSLTKISFWNDGRDSIRKEDHIPSDILRIVPKKGVNIYDYSLNKINPNNNIQIVEKENQLEVRFDFLDQYDGFVLNIFHNGNKKENLEILGSFIGSKKISKGEPDTRISSGFLNSVFNLMPEGISRIKFKLIRYVIVIILLIPILAIIFGLIIPVLVLDLFNNLFFNKTPKEYFLEDDNV